MTPKPNLSSGLMFLWNPHMYICNKLSHFLPLMCLMLIWLLLQIEELSKGRRKNCVFLPQTRKNRKREIWNILNSLEDLCWEEQINGFRSRECLIEAFKVKKEVEEKKKHEGQTKFLWVSLPKSHGKNRITREDCREDKH